MSHMVTTTKEEFLEGHCRFQKCILDKSSVVRRRIKAQPPEYKPSV